MWTLFQHWDQVHTEIETGEQRYFFKSCFNCLTFSNLAFLNARVIADNVRVGFFGTDIIFFFYEKESEWKIYGFDLIKA